MSSAEKPLFDIEPNTVPPNIRLAAMHRESARIIEENKARDMGEVPFIMARLATAAETTIIVSRVKVPEDFDYPPAA
jgi:hypothetical protein